MNAVVGVNLNILREATCEDRDLAIELLNLFFEQTALEQKRLNRAAEQRDAQELSAVAHKIAGSCSACGMTALSARMRELEALCRQSIPADIEARLQDTARELQEIRRGLETHFNCPFTP